MSDKASDAFKTISEVSALLDVPSHVLRFWESKFGSLQPLKRSGGRRYYRPNDVTILRQIQQLLYVDGFTIKGAQKILRSKKFTGDTISAAVKSTHELQSLDNLSEILDEVRIRLSTLKRKLEV